MSTDEEKITVPEEATARIRRFDLAASLAILSLSEADKDALVVAGYAAKRGYVSTQSCRARLIGVNPTVYSDMLSGRRGDEGTALKWLDRWAEIDVPGLGKLPKLDSVEILGLAGGAE